MKSAENNKLILSLLGIFGGGGMNWGAVIAYGITGNFWYGYVFLPGSAIFFTGMILFKRLRY